MVNYFCPNCNKDFNKKSNYINHVQNKKKPCNQNELKMHQNAPKCTKNAPNYTENINIQVDNSSQKVIEDTKKGYICNFCDVSFTRSTTLKRHLIERCKARKEEIQEKEAIFQELLKQNELLKNQNEKLNNQLLEQNKLIIELLVKKNIKDKDKSKNIQNNKNIKNQNNGIINNIIIQHGKEDLTKIENKVFFDAFLKYTGAKIPEKIIEGIHFNSEYPEFKNIYISDINREKVMIYNGIDWILTPSNNITSNLLERSIDFSENRYDALDKKILNQHKKTKIENGLKIMELMKDIDVDEDEYENQPKKEDKERRQYLREKAEEYIKLLLYNNKDTVTIKK
jgi:hypothetical protein